MSTSRDCPDCDAPNRAKNSHCHNCGAKLPRLERKPEFALEPPAGPPEVPAAVLEKHPELVRFPNETDAGYSKRCRVWMRDEIIRIKEARRIETGKQARVEPGQTRAEAIACKHAKDMESLQRAGFDTSTSLAPHQRERTADE